MKKIMVVTGTRAEYGLLYWTMKEIEQDDDLKLQLTVTGNHLVKDYGYTVEQINKDGFNIDEEIDMIINSDKKSSIVKSMGLEIIQMAQCFDRLKPDLLLILGDRYETFTAATCAMMMNIPIAHMNGGESTEGAVDEQIRHAITKMAHIHFAGAEYYRERIVKMGEESWRVFNVGQAGIENIMRLNLMDKSQLERELNISFNKPVFLITYHPETIGSLSVLQQINNLLDALIDYDAILIFTYPNADFGSKVIIEKINQFVKSNNNAYVYQSLGSKKYLSLLKYADIMIGNSSSGIIESPAFKIPVVNIGDRQKGRLRNSNIVDSGCKKEEIKEAIDKVLYSKEFKEGLEHIKNLYGDGNVSKKIVSILKSVAIDEKLLSKKLTY
ncbi:MAG: UDP-N-acetylglucosamine 2-epimerase [Solirubrobacterales bacterium]